MLQIKPIVMTTILACFFIIGCSPITAEKTLSTDGRAPWILIDDFESNADSVPGMGMGAWTHVDVQNETKPFVPNPQIAEVRLETETGNKYLLKKPAADGIVGNRKALGFKALSHEIPVGETYTIYTRVNVEYFPNNHSFGLSNLIAPEISQQNYNAFEPMIRITDKVESDGSRNDGTLMVLSGYKSYSKILNPKTNKSAAPLKPGTWYELWCVVNNARQDAGGQTYDLHVRGGEFLTQHHVFSGAVFRMKREASLKYFMTISNTGPHDAPYGNGGVKYDDIYMASGENLSSPLKVTN